jgi:hypothetical protein
MTHTQRWRMWGACGAAALVLAAGLLAAGGGTAARAADRPVIGIADFYSIPPPPLFLLLDPERYAADVSTGVLIRAGGPAITVLPRGEVRAAERKLNWRTYDVLNFSRLQTLGQSIQADRLVVGRISRISIYHAGLGLFGADAAITMQIFDTRQGRIVWEHDTLASETAGDPDFALEIALDRAVAVGIRAALPAVSAPVDRMPTQ